jgi:DNA-binding CsgD family transcriptional regulator
VEYLYRIVERPLTDPATVGAAAWLLDETELAVRLLRQGLDRLRAPGMRGGSGGALSALQWACFDSGRWDEALAAAQEARDAAAAYRMQTVAASADLCTAAVLALRGDPEQVQASLSSALGHADAMEYRSAAARARHSAGMAALAQGSHVAAYDHLRHLFAADATPLHHRVSYLGIADLAAAAVRAERHLEARALIERVLAPMDTAGPRLHQLAARARGLLAEPAYAEAHFDKGLSDPAGDRWPFERAQLRLDYGEWLRRQRRINDAKPVLAAALETLRRLGATPWTRRAEAELRACGVTTQALSTGPDPLAGLTAQQREIVVLAGNGLTNGEIADRLFLSPRTVASHLYRAYPKLGIAGRHQLRDLTDQASTTT